MEKHSKAMNSEGMAENSTAVTSNGNERGPRHTGLFFVQYPKLKHGKKRL